MRVVLGKFHNGQRFLRHRVNHSNGASEVPIVSLLPLDLEF
jgi:hypothetical protein